jgi:hypothetical protein
MRNLAIFFFFLVCFSGHATEKTFNSELKRKLSFEVTVLEHSLIAAQSETQQLRQDKLDIDVKLQNMENWGLDQEKEKNSYYAQLVTNIQKVADTQAKVDQEKEKGRATLDRYHRVKSLLGYMAGLILAYLYIQLGADLAAKALSLVSGPWAYIFLKFLGPIGAFTVGYFTVNILF